MGKTQRKKREKILKGEQTNEILFRKRMKRNQEKEQINEPIKKKY